MDPLVMVILLVTSIILLSLWIIHMVEASPIPKQVWTYWDAEEIPDLVKRCINTWRVQNPRHQVVVLQPSTLGLYVHPDDMPAAFTELTPQRQSDWLRLYLLGEYGGYWIDASTILTRPIPSKNRTAHGFYLKEFTTNRRCPVIESWFIAAVPRQPFIMAWFQEFDRVCRTYGNDGEGYLEELSRVYGQERYNRLLQKIVGPTYLTIHMVAQKIMQIDGMEPYHCDGAEDGPYYLLIQSDWDQVAFCEKLTSRYKGRYIPGMIKMRSLERNVMIEYVKIHTPTEDSIYSRFLQSP